MPSIDNLYEGSVNIGSKVNDGGTTREKVGTATVESLKSLYRQEENPYSELDQKILKTVAVASLVSGSYSQNQAMRAYNQMDFENDAYLSEIGMSKGKVAAEAALDEHKGEKITLSSSQSAIPGLNIDTSDNNRLSMPVSGLTTEQMSDIQKAGVLQFNGVDYQASISGDSVNLNSFGDAFHNPNSIKIDIDPLKNITTMHATVSGITQKEIAEAKTNGSFQRDGVKYQVHGDTSSLTADSRVSVSATAYSGSRQANYMYSAVHVPANDVTYSMNGASLNHTDIKKLANNGEYQLGGMTFHAVNLNFGEYCSLAAKAANEKAAVQDTVSAHGRKDKAAVISNIQNAGVKYIKSQDSFLQEHFDGSAGSIKKCKREMTRQLSIAQKNGNNKDIVKYQKQLSLLKEYENHGGKIENPTVNRYQRLGMLTVGNAVLGRDMMRGINYYTAAGKMTKTAYRAAKGATSKLAYMGSSTANRIISKSIVKVTGSSNNAISGRLNKWQEIKSDKYNKVKQARKDAAAARRNGTYKQYRRQLRNDKWNAKGDALSKKIEMAKGNNNLGKVSDKKIERLTRRKERYEKVSRFRSGLKNKLDFRGRARNWWNKSRLKNSKLTKIAVAPFKAVSSTLNRFNLIKQWIRRLLLKIAGIGILVYAAIFIMMVFPAFVGYLFSHFFSVNPLEGYESLEGRINNAINYQQLIVTTVDEDISTDFEVVCAIDATYHYLQKKQVPSKKYPWFASPKFGNINHLWAWEQSDNTSRYLTEEDEEKDADELYNDEGILVGSGDYVYLDSYLPQPERDELDSLTFNLYPIVAMSHYRYYDEFSFEQWETILGYTYYMYAVSHDIAKYDADSTQYSIRFQEYEDDTWDPGYDYYIETHAEDIVGNPAAEIDILYADGIEWDPMSHTLARSDEVCSNIYIHDFSPRDFENQIKSSIGFAPSSYKGHNEIASSKSAMPSYSLENASNGNIFSDFFSGVTFRSIRARISQVASKVLKGEDPGTTSGDTWDKGYTDVNSALSLALRKKALKGITIENGVAQYDRTRFEATIQTLANTTSVLDINNNKSGIFLYDGTEASLPHSQEIPSALNKNVVTQGDTQGQGDLFNSESLGAVCDNYLELAYGNVVDSYENRAEDLLMDGDPGYIAGCHVHELTCHPLICDTSEHTHTQECNDGDCGIEAHTHGVSCYDTSEGNVICGHNHSEWVSKDSPGCWKTITICPGHCGSHLDPLINIVEKVTYQGLADEDNFRTPKWLTVEEITNASTYSRGGLYGYIDSLLEDDIVTVAQFRSYWYAKINRWFSPIPRSPWSFFKKTGEYNLSILVKRVDATAAVVSGFFNWVRGESNSFIEAVTEAWDSSHNNDGLTADDSIETNDRMWEGWWDEPNVFDQSLYEEVSAIYGNWEEDRYEISKDFWSETTTAEMHVDFPQHGIHNVIYSQAEIEELIKKIEESLGMDLSGLNDTQRAILIEALRRCGMFSYSLSGTAHKNGAYGDGGSADCSGWVTGVLMRALGLSYDEINTNAAGFASRGNPPAERVPGSIIAKVVNGKSYSGHVMIYVGYIDGDGPYVMDCSSSAGGSSLRKVSESYLNSYNYTWNPWE